MVLAAGDITISGHESYATRFVECVRAHDVPLLLVHGNNDGPEAVRVFREHGVTIHRRSATQAGHCFVGIGGDGYAPHDTELGPGESIDLPVDGSILLTHIPPARIELTKVDGDHVPRSFEFGQPVEGGPRAHICGHVHHTEGVGYLAGTKVIKLRAAMWNSCALLDLDTLRTTFLTLEP